MPKITFSNLVRVYKLSKHQPDTSIGQSLLSIILRPGIITLAFAVPTLRHGKYFNMEYMACIAEVGRYKVVYFFTCIRNDDLKYKVRFTCGRYDVPFGEPEYQPDNHKWHTNKHLGQLYDSGERILSRDYALTCPEFKLILKSLESKG